MTIPDPRQPLSIKAMGDAALMLRWPGSGLSIAPGVVAAVGEAIRKARLRGVVDVVPGPGSVLVRFDPARTSVGGLTERLSEVAAAGGSARPRDHSIPVRYGGEDGPDLSEVAARLGLLEEEVVSRHDAAMYTVLATGFTPGFVYLGPLPRSLRLPRREEPRLAVAPGSIAIGDAQTGVYGVRSGGGWWIIGRAAAPTFWPQRRPPVALAIGDRVVFEAVP